MREVLHGEDDKVAGFTAAQVIAKGQHRRRARTAAVSGVALVAAGAVAVVPSALAGGHGPGRGGVVSAAGGPVQSVSSAPSSTARVVAAPPTSPVSSASSSSSAPAVRVVKPGKTDLGGGYSLTLTSDSSTLTGHDGQVGPNYTDNGNQGADTIGIQGCGSVIAGLYIGKGEAASGTVTVDGKSYPLTIVTLAGHPGWSVAYALLPAPPKTTSATSISVSDAAGHQLASFTDPGRKH
ncbi:hypothetical protein [Catenulispora sp. GP43]|uniref:hypothetical protein n=1 Tax=Catenulispora sp. GP43 TaxID=3156263 RepID=UPI003515D185